MPTRRSFLMHTAGAAVIAAASAPATEVCAANKTTILKGLINFVRVPHTDLVISRIAYGASGLHADANRLRLINTVVDNGINLFDQADMNEGEEALGKALRQSPALRDRIVIQSKCAIVFGEQRQMYLDCSRNHIVSAVEGSLQRIGTDHLDILLLHWPDALVEPEEVAKAFDELKHSGKVRYFGVSNHTPSQIDLLKEYVNEPLVANQIYLSLENSHQIAGSVADLTNPFHAYNYTVAASTLDYCRLRKIQIQAWAPLARNLLKPGADAKPELKHAAQLLTDIARDKKVQPSAIALAWLLRHPAGIVPIFSSTNPEHVNENCAAMHVNLSQEEWYALLTASSRIQFVA